MKFKNSFVTCIPYEIINIKFMFNKTTYKHTINVHKVINYSNALFLCNPFCYQNISHWLKTTKKRNKELKLVSSFNKQNSFFSLTILLLISFFSVHCIFNSQCLVFVTIFLFVFVVISITHFSYFITWRSILLLSIILQSSYSLSFLHSPYFCFTKINEMLSFVY